MLLILRHTDGRWCAPSIESGDGFEEGYGERWAEAVCETLGLPAGSLVPHIVEDDADPRSGVLLTDPNVASPEEALAPVDRIAQLEARIDAIAAYAGVPIEVIAAAKPV
jgi:hypothetical protein